MTQEAIATQIAQHLTVHKDALAQYWRQSGPVRHFYLDDLLPAEWAMQFYKALPDPESLLERNSIKERKRVGIKLENYDELVGFILFAFQEQPVLDIVSEITGCKGLHADRS
ncbi:MAG: hypothetical protein JNL13_07315, partial [Chitinophagaceae bacterium]|nr:hypothetical protein [Chitinophagaceae bacterium]